MMIADLIQDVNAAGLEVSVSESGGLKLRGDPAIVEKWLPILKEHKPEIVAHLMANISDPSDLYETYTERAGIMAAHLLFWSTVGFGVCLATGHA